MKMRFFFVTSLEQVWLARNRKRIYDGPVVWTEIAKTVRMEYNRHWKACIIRLRKRRVGMQLHGSKEWISPLEGQVKFNFDASFTDGKTTIGCVSSKLPRHDIRSLGEPLGFR